MHLLDRGDAGVGPSVPRMKVAPSLLEDGVRESSVFAGGTLIAFAEATNWLTDEKVGLLPSKREYKHKPGDDQKKKDGKDEKKPTPDLPAAKQDKAKVIKLGLEYNLLTRFTSFVAVDTVARKSPDLMTHNTVKQPSPLPAGVPNTAVGGGTIPEPSSALLWLAGILTLLFQRRRRAVATR